MNKLNIMKRTLLALIMCLSFALCGCGDKNQVDTSFADTTQSEDASAGEVVIDYGDAESFEAALNEGKNLEGKVVRFVVNEFHPQSKLGYNVWAGEHLNFVSSRNPDVQENDTMIVRTTTIENLMGSWIINYEKVNNAVVTEDTIIYSKPKETTAATTKQSTTKRTETTTATEAMTTQTEESSESTTTAMSDEDARKAVENGDYSLVTPEFKETMDAYEAFYDEYIAFMKKYTSGEGDIMSMLTDYTNMLDLLDEWSRKIDAIDESTLSPADDAYFLLVTLRVEQKLLSSL